MKQIVKTVKKPNWKKIEDDYVNGINMEGEGTFLPSLNDIAELHHVNYLHVTRRSAEYRWNAKRKQRHRDIKSKLMDLKIDDVDMEKSKSLDGFKAPKNEETVNNCTVMVSEKVMGTFAKCILDSIREMALTIQENNSSLTVNEIGHVLLHTHELCLDIFTDLSMSLEKVQRDG